MLFRSVMSTRHLREPRSDLANRLRERRSAAGWTQMELAGRVGITRQSLINLESGKFVPSTTVALKLARAFGCHVEDVFSLVAPANHPRADLATPLGSDAANRRTRVVLGFVDGRWVAHPLRGEEAITVLADGVVNGGDLRRSVDVEPLRTEADARSNLIVTGCDPALTVIASWLAEASTSVHIRVLHAPSRQALAALGQGFTHVAGTHLLDEVSGDYNVPFVRRACARRGAIVFHLARWEEGFVVRSGNPLSIRGAADLTRRKVRLIGREPGSGAQSLLERELRKARISPAAIHPVAQIACGHRAVAQTIACGAADVGVATRSAAVAYGLDFLPLTDERSDLVVGAELRDDPRIGRLTDALRGSALRREIASLGGYQTDDSGQLVAEVNRR